MAAMRKGSKHFFLLAVLATSGDDALVGLMTPTQLVPDFNATSVAFSQNVCGIKAFARIDRAR